MGGRGGPRQDEPYDPENPTLPNPAGAAPRGGARNGQNGAVPRRPHGPFRLRKDTLVIENIPPEHCSLDKVHGYFKRFGNITNVNMETRANKATIQFENLQDAKEAYSCPESIFGNRFVKAYFFREYENGTPAASPPRGPRTDVSRPAVTAQPVEPVKTPQQLQKEKALQLLELQKDQKILIDKQIEEQKSLMERLTATQDPREKTELMRQLRVLTSSTESIVTKAAEQTQWVKAAAGVTVDKEKERLDRELDLLKAASSQESMDTDTVDPAIKAKLEALQAEAKALGVPGHTGSAYAPRGSIRGRGRGAARGFRGGSANRSFRLDNRAKKLVVSGTSDSFLPALEEHCKVRLEG